MVVFVAGSIDRFELLLLFVVEVLREVHRSGLTLLGALDALADLLHQLGVRQDYQLGVGQHFKLSLANGRHGARYLSLRSCSINFGISTVTVFHRISGSMSK